MKKLAIIILILAALVLVAPAAAKGRAEPAAKPSQPAPFVLLNGVRCLPVGQWEWADTYTVRKGSIVALEVAWVMTSDEYADDFLLNTTRTATINGQQIFNEADYWAVEVLEISPPSSEYPEANQVLYWTYPPLGPLQNGSSIVFDWSWTAEAAFTDGIFDYELGDGSSHTCTVVW